jgi:GTP cyclohydrolase I
MKTLSDLKNHETSYGLAGDEHFSASAETPLRPDAFVLSDQQKIKLIAGHFHEIMHTLGLDMNDDSLKGTPQRVAKMYVQEIFSGLNPDNKPQVALFGNKYGYQEMLVEKTLPCSLIANTILYLLSGKFMWPIFPVKK